MLQGLMIQVRFQLFKTTVWICSGKEVDQQIEMKLQIKQSFLACLFVDQQCQCWPMVGGQQVGRQARQQKKRRVHGPIDCG